MEDKKVSILGSGLIWFGAAVSIAEILTGTLLAPLGFKKGVAAVILGHVIGCVLLYFAGLIGAKTEKSAMETVKGSFGNKGSLLFSVLNIVQLVGWTAVMIIGGAKAAAVIADAPLHMPRYNNYQYFMYFSKWREKLCSQKFYKTLKKKHRSYTALQTMLPSMIVQIFCWHVDALRLWRMTWVKCRK